MRPTILWVFIAILFTGCKKNDVIALKLVNAFAGSIELNLTQEITTDIPTDPSITLIFSAPVNGSTITQSITLKSVQGLVNTNINLTSDNTVIIYPIGSLINNTIYTLAISNELKGSGGQSFESKEFQFKTVLADLKITSFKVGNVELGTSNTLNNVDVDLSITLNFSTPINTSSLEEAAQLSGAGDTNLKFTYSDFDQTAHIASNNSLDYLLKYEFSISDKLKGKEGEPFTGASKILYTELDSTYKFPEVTDDELLTKIQQQTFKYFWDFGHPTSGLARERDTSGNTVTIGGSGFGVMAILVGIERGFITRKEGVDRLEKIVNFLSNADRFHGVWPHWMNGETGEVIPFSADDDGGDLVETAFMIQGLLTVKQFLSDKDSQEAGIITKITQLWEEVEWDWYTQDGQNVLYWHWSPNFEWQKNHKIQGWNEALIIYVLAASSPTHTIGKSVYTEGWARNGAMVNGNNFYGLNLPLGSDRGGPLFFAHYSFLGLDPRNLEDQYANYWEQNKNHTLINRAYCISNPNGYVGYGATAWGLTASDGNMGYSAHSPNNDRGVITPTAAISSIPYTPQESLDAIHHFYYLMGDKLWGEYGFYDAYNVTENWYASSYIAIDQGPIIVMIENYRTGLLWDLFMSNNEITQGLTKLGL